MPSTTTTPTTTTKTTTTVPKNKFLSLFSKGKSSKDKSNNSKLPTDQQHSAKVKDSNKTNSTTPSSTEPSKANKRHSKNNKSSSNNQDNDSLNKSAAESKFETKKQQFNVNYLDPSKSLVHVEIDGIPVRVAYETFV